MNKTISRLLCLALSLGVTHVSLSQTRELGSSGEMLDGIAALVDTGVILKSELSYRLDAVAQDFLQRQMALPPEERSQLPPLSQLEQQVLDQLILEEIQVQRAGNIGIEIGDTDLNQVLAEIARSVGTTLAELPGWLMAQNIDYGKFREEQRRDLTIRALERAEVVNRIAINPREFEQCVTRAVASQTDDFEYNISHILLGFSSDATPAEIDAVETRVREISRELDEGADFAQLAVAYSETQTALEGGSLGWMTGAALPPMLADEVTSMTVGEHSTPIRRAGGFHLVRLNDMRGIEPQLVDQVRARHILLETTEVLDNDATRQKLQGIHDQIVGGDDFATLAGAVSDDTGSAVDGGDLGWTTADTYVPEFRNVLESLAIGEMSEPFQTPYGWHIVELVDKRTYDMTDDLREQECRSQIGNGKVVEERELWRRRLRDEAYVVKRI